MRHREVTEKYLFVSRHRVSTMCQVLGYVLGTMSPRPLHRGWGNSVGKIRFSIDVIPIPYKKKVVGNSNHSRS